MAAVVFGPDRAVRYPSSGRIGLVLGAGGVLGAAWMTGALASLQDRLPCAAGDVDVIVGTSAGSVLAAALRCRAELGELMAWQRGQATGILRESAAIAALDGPLPPLPHLRVGSVPLARAGLLRPHQVPPWVAASGWLPYGRGQHTALRSLIGALQRRHHQQEHQQQTAAGPSQPWVRDRTWIAAMDYDTDSGCSSASAVPRRLAARRRGRLLLHPGLVRAGHHRRPPLRGRRRAVRDLAEGPERHGRGRDLCARADGQYRSDHR